MPDPDRCLPTAEDEAAFRRLFPGYTRYCPHCQRAAMERHMDHDSRWYAACCPRCATEDILDA